MKTSEKKRKSIRELSTPTIKTRITSVVRAYIYISNNCRNLRKIIDGVLVYFLKFYPVNEIGLGIERNNKNLLLGLKENERFSFNDQFVAQTVVPFS